MDSRQEHQKQSRVTTQPAITLQPLSQSTPSNGQGHGTWHDGLFDREPPPEYLQEWTQRIAAEKSIVEAGTQSVVIFRIAGEWLALSTRIIQEVTEGSGMHRIPHHRSGALIGLASVRGNLVVCASLGAVLGLEEPRTVGSENQKLSHSRLLIVNQRPAPLAVPVDEVYGVHRYHPREFKDVPATLANAKAMYTTGLLLWQEKAVGCLDHELLLYTLNKGLL